MVAGAILANGLAPLPKSVCTMRYFVAHGGGSSCLWWLMVASWFNCGAYLVPVGVLQSGTPMSGFVAPTSVGKVFKVVVGVLFFGGPVRVTAIGGAMMKVILLLFRTGLVFGRRWWCVAAVLGFVDYTCWFLFPGSELIVGRGHRYGCVSFAAPVWYVGGSISKDRWITAGSAQVG